MQIYQTYSFKLKKIVLIVNLNLNDSLYENVIL